MQKYKDFLFFLKNSYKFQTKTRLPLQMGRPFCPRPKTKSSRRLSRRKSRPKTKSRPFCRSKSRAKFKHRLRRLVKRRRQIRPRRRLSQNTVFQARTRLKVPKKNSKLKNVFIFSHANSKSGCQNCACDDTETSE